MKLIVEHIEDIELLTEEKDGKEYTYIQGAVSYTHLTLPTICSV